MGTTAFILTGHALQIYTKYRKKNKQIYVIIWRICKIISPSVHKVEAITFFLYKYKTIIIKKLQTSFKFHNSITFVFSSSFLHSNSSTSKIEPKTNVHKNLQHTLVQFQQNFPHTYINWYLNAHISNIWPYTCSFLSNILSLLYMYQIQLFQDHLLGGYYGNYLIFNRVTCTSVISFFYLPFNKTNATLLNQSHAYNCTKLIIIEYLFEMKDECF